MIASLVGEAASAFRGPVWPGELSVFRADADWFRALASMPILNDPEEWLDRAPELVSFRTLDLLARSDARRRFLAGESIYIVGLDRTVRPLRDLCDALAADLDLDAKYVMVQAWAAGGPTTVGMHFDLDYNFNLQAAGRKEWRTAPNDLVAHPISSHHAALGDATYVNDAGRALPTEMPADARTFEVGPGDVVYVPRGVWHATRTTDATFAIAFVIQPPTWADHVARALETRLHADARWRERVMGARDLARHAALKATAGEALSAAREALATLGPSEVLYRSLWGQRPAAFRLCAGVDECRLDAGTLSWQREGRRHELAVPAWARTAVDRAIGALPWSLAALHDLVGNDDVPFLNLLVKRMVDEGVIEPAPAASGGVARV
jgi:hypothetical protein